MVESAVLPVGAGGSPPPNSNRDPINDDGGANDKLWVVAGMLLVGVGAIAAWFLYLAVKPPFFKPSSDYAVFAGLFVVAQALERLLEPLSNLIGPKTDETKKNRDTAKENRDTAIAASRALEIKDDPELAKTAAGHQAEAVKQQAEAARHQKTLDDQRRHRAITLWCVATFAATLISAVLGLFLLRSVSAPLCSSASSQGATTTTTASTNPTVCTAENSDKAIQDAKNSKADQTKDTNKSDPGPNRFVDLLLTGLVVGSGTKPLHDLVTRIQATKDNTKDAAATVS